MPAPCYAGAELSSGGLSYDAARLARHLIGDGVDQKLADSLAEHVADEIERTVATKDHVEMVVTRESQQLRLEMHQLRGEMHQFRAGMHQEFSVSTSASHNGSTPSRAR